MLTQSSSGEVVLVATGGPTNVLFGATNRFLRFLVIHFVLDCHAVHHDTLRYLGVYRLMSYEETKNALRSPERPFENLIFVRLKKKKH